MTKKPDEPSADEGPGQWADTADIFSRYWRAHGGIRVVLTSPYLHVALLLSILLAPHWLRNPWYNDAIAVLPNIVGFAIAGYAIWTGWADERFRDILLKAEVRPNVSVYLHVSATFAHFAVIQLIALLYALACKGLIFDPSEPSVWTDLFFQLRLPLDYFAWLAIPGRGIGFFLFVYALLLALEATIELFRIASWFQRFHSRK